MDGKIFVGCFCWNHSLVLIILTLQLKPQQCPKLQAEAGEANLPLLETSRSAVIMLTLP